MSCGLGLYAFSFFKRCCTLPNKKIRRVPTSDRCKHRMISNWQNSRKCASNRLSRQWDHANCRQRIARPYRVSDSKHEFGSPSLKPFSVPKVNTGRTTRSLWSHVLDRWCTGWSLWGMSDVAISTCLSYTLAIIRRAILAMRCIFRNVLWWLHHFWPAAFMTSTWMLCFSRVDAPNFAFGIWYYSLCISCQVESVARILQVGRKLACAHRQPCHRCKKQSRRKWRGMVCATSILHLLFQLCAWFVWVKFVFRSIAQVLYDSFNRIHTLFCRFVMNMNLWNPNILRWCFWVFLIYTVLESLGEASNPGPPNFQGSEIDMSVDPAQTLWVGNCNPTQLLGKEEVFSSWGGGIWTVSETSSTASAFVPIRNRLKMSGLNVQFGDPVLPQQASTAMRGRAGGVAVVTNHPVRKYQYPSPDYLYKSTRFLDTIVQVQDNLAILVCTLYGVAGITSPHSMSLTHDVFAQAVDRVAKFRGPSIICGDLNIDVETIHSWNTLKTLGWKDLAILDQEVNCREPKPTSKFGHRHSYIIASPELCRCFKTCQVVETYDFDSHPLLVAGFDIPLYFTPTLQWKLPKPFDTYMFDEGLLVDNATKFCSQRSKNFDASMQRGDMDQAARQFTLAFEETLKHSAVTSDGSFCNIPEGHFGRGKGNPFVLRKPNVVNVKPGRNGDFTPILTQSNCSLRAHTKQLRRIQAFRQQIESAERTGSETCLESCHDLWKCILNGHGFRKGFASWIGSELGLFVPLSTPSSIYADELLESFLVWHKKELNEFYLQKNVNKRFTIIDDIANGGRWCFSQVRDASTPPLSTISWQTECEIKRVPWKKQGLSTLHLREHVAFDINSPVIFQGQTRNIASQTGCVLRLDEPVKLKNLDQLKVFQTQTSAEISNMHEQLHKTWSDLWGRDIHNTHDEHWPDACCLISSLEDCPSCPFKPLTKELWDASLRGVKPKSARGADGFSTRDCKLIKGNLLEWLLEILRSVESGQAWPNQWCIAKITVLSKGFEPKSPLDIRPISILAKFYRLWSRLRSLEVLQHIGMQLPPQVAATSGGVSADILAAFTANEIECSTNQKHWICGLIVDLVKCYNLVPWVPCRKICQKLGIPDAYIDAMFSHLKQLRRSFEIHGACSEFVVAFNGIAEGCAMSVALMSALSWFAHKCIDNFTHEAFAICYADNWGLIAESPESLVPATQRLERVVEALRMKISIGKSWTWTTNLTWKNRLKQVKIHGIQVDTKSNVVDLGCDQNYNRKRTIPTQSKRLGKAKRVLKRIRKLKIPQKFKSTMVQACGFGAFAYGSEITGVSNWTWKSLRSSVVNGLGKGAACASPYLSCLFYSSPFDPQLRHVIRTALFWRRFFGLFPTKKAGFLHNMSRSQKAKGPARCFQEAFNKIGWATSADGNLKHESGFQFNWVDCSRSYLRKVLRLFWTFHAAQMSSHRKDFDLVSIDEASVMHCLAKRPQKDKSLLLSHMAGKACTNASFSKFNHSISPLCENCGVPETREHRLLKCPLFESSRSGAKRTLTWAQKQGITTTNLTLIPLDIRPLIRLNRLAIPQFCSNVPSLCEQVRIVFTDGSAFWQNDFVHSLAGMAAIECEFLAFSYNRLFADPLPGIDMNSYRAESFAILKALSSVSRPKIFSDCQVALDQFWYMLDCRIAGIQPKFSDHQDIWGQIWFQISHRPPKWIEAVKTAAHVDLKHCSNKHQKWEAWMNNKVDELAKTAVQGWPNLFAFNKKSFHELEIRRKHLRTLHDVVIDQASKVTPNEYKKTEVNEGEKCFNHLIPPATICSPYQIGNIPEGCPFPPLFLQRVIEWASCLQWPTPSFGEVSALELYIDFTLHSKSFAPVNIGYVKGVGTTYALKDQCRKAEVTYQSLAQQSWIWNMFLKWARLHDFKLWEGSYVPRTTSLKNMGFTLWTAGISNRPRFTKGDMAYHIINKLLVTKAGKVRNFNVAYHGPQMVL